MQPIILRAFGSVSALVGFQEAAVSCAGPLPLRAVLDELRSKYPLFTKYLGQADVEDNLMICCTDRELHLDSMVQPGDELVLITPISGG
jgi:molybdopterin converting factor small subunit